MPRLRARTYLLLALEKAHCATGMMGNNSIRHDG
jgi:hypothetical protein